MKAKAENLPIPMLTSLKLGEWGIGNDCIAPALESNGNPYLNFDSLPERKPFSEMLVELK